MICFCFSIWMIFFDANSLLYHYQLNQKIKNIKNEKTILKQNMINNLYIYNKLRNNKNAIKRYAKKHFFYKKI